MDLENWIKKQEQECEARKCGNIRNDDYNYCQEEPKK